MMKKNNILIIILLGALIVVCIGYSRSWAQASRQILPAKVGVVNVDLVFRNSRRHAKWKIQMDTEMSKLQAKMDKLRADGAAAEADMLMREVGSPDYMRLMSDYLDKVAEADARNKYYEQEMILKGVQWMTKLYSEIRSIVEKTAKLRKLDIVLVANEVVLPALSATELSSVIRTNKILYHTDEIDITEEVIAQLDSAL